jgi:MoxR-like ATPase
LIDRLRPNAQSAFFQKIENKVLLIDRATWIRDLFDRASAQRIAYADRRKQTVALRADIETNLAGFDAAEVRRRMTSVERALETLATGSELNAPIHQDMILLKDLHARLREKLGGGKAR